MISSTLRIAGCVLSTACALHAAAPDISNLKNCIKDVRLAENSPPVVPTFDPYKTNYSQLISDLETATADLPHVYQEAAAKPLIQFLQNLGELQFLQVFGDDPTEDQYVLQQIIPDAALSILFQKGIFTQGVNAFQEIVSDLYDGFLSQATRVGMKWGHPIDPPTYGVIPPLVKFGEADSGPYTWPTDTTNQLLGMHCAIVSLPPAQIKGGLLAWCSLGHETGGHDVLHADEGLIDELAQKVYEAVYKKFKSHELADYWASCIDETASDVCGYLNMGPSLGIGLIGYFRALGNGRLRTVGSKDDPHPIDLLRGYLGAAVVKRLHFKDAEAWSQVIRNETSKDDGPLYLVDENGSYHRFPVSFDQAVASVEVVAQAIIRSTLTSLQEHSLQGLQDWTDADQNFVDEIVPVLKAQGQLPANVDGSGFYAAYVVAAATQAALERGANIPLLFSWMQNFLVKMHLENPTWSQTPTEESVALLEQGLKDKKGSQPAPHYVIAGLPENVLIEQF